MYYTLCVFFFKQKTAYELRISDWSSDVCSSDLGGHDVPTDKIRARYERLWPLVAAARELADRTTLYDNTNAEHPFREIAVYDRGRLIGEATWPTWTPSALLD